MRFGPELNRRLAGSLNKEHADPRSACGDAT